MMTSCTALSLGALCFNDDGADDALYDDADAVRLQLVQMGKH